MQPYYSSLTLTKSCKGGGVYQQMGGVWWQGAFNSRGLGN